MLNYLYSIAAAETRLACLEMGPDPSLGVYHFDESARDSLVYDLIEPVRPLVDDYLLDLLEGHVFRAADFYETRRGVCRVGSGLASHLAATGPRWAKHVRPVTERVAQMLLPGQNLPTPLTHQSQKGKRQDPPTEREPKVFMPPQSCLTVAIRPKASIATNVGLGCTWRLGVAQRLSAQQVGRARRQGGNEQPSCPSSVRKTSAGKKHTHVPIPTSSPQESCRDYRT